ncbi:hypothetical protein DY000_02048356 [Brassica cretica]|uniref:RRM domain-containing protein n=1 Tax=Brassica cretica TaxID=69181 RepID=A0ABQ7F2A5_BRACR|nr:hypothetical protein DY000_02048356 [Brassica cretica]
MSQLVSSVKVIRNKQTCQSEGYGFVEFLSRSAAEEVLQSYSGVTMPNAEQPFRLNWASFSTGEKRASENGPDLSIFVGDLAPDVTDAVLLETFAAYQSVKGAKVVIDSNTGRSKGYGFVRSQVVYPFRVSSVKVIRNKQTCQSEGYGFVEFLSRSAAEEVLQSYSGVTMPNAEQPFRLNWASFSTGEKRASENGPDLSIFVGDLAPDVTDAVLLETFAAYQSVKGAKVVIDSNTGRSKGYGFVRFGDENERSKALTEMNGAFCSSRQMRVGVATPKRAAAYGQQNGSQALTLAGGHGGNGSMADGESNNATSAEEAIGSLNGTVIGKNTVRLSWGRSPNKQWRSDSGNQWNGGYSRGQGYNNGYGNQDSNMYATSAAAVPGAS